MADGRGCVSLGMSELCGLQCCPLAWSCTDPVSFCSEGFVSTEVGQWALPYPGEPGTLGDCGELGQRPHLQAGV